MGIFKDDLNYKDISDYVEKQKNIFIDISDRIWGFAETRYEEKQSAAFLSDVFEKEGFHVTRGIAGIETAFKASFGKEGPEIGILGEYDALSGMSQKADTAKKEPIQAGGSGHGCGHHLLGTGSLAAAVAVKKYLEAHHLPGTVSYFGCPAEEGGSGKGFMARRHVFDGLDAALTWHPQAINAVMCCSMLANVQVYFRFYGVSAHAAAAPHLGRSALDAVELMNVGVNYLREHIIPEARVHYAVTDTGGVAPNVVQSTAEVLYLIRSPDNEQVQEIYQRVVDIAKGAALMTGTRVELKFDNAVSNIIINETLSSLLQKEMTAAGIPALSKKDRAFASDIQKTLGEPELKAAWRLIDHKDAVRHAGAWFMDWLQPMHVSEQAWPASSDMGDVSWVTPTAFFVTACYAMGTPDHSWQLVAQGKTDMAHNGMLYAARVLALAALELMDTPELLEKAKAEFRERLGTRTYICPIPSDIAPAAER